VHVEAVDVLVVLLGSAIAVALLYIASDRSRRRAAAAYIVARMRAIRAFDALGTGVRLLGISARTDGRATCTRWITLLYLPLWPIDRRVVAWCEPSFGDEARWIDHGRTPIVATELVRTWLFGWILFPLLFVAPWIVMVLLERTTDMPSLRGALAILGVPWLAMSLFLILRWDQNRKWTRLFRQLSVRNGCRIQRFLAALAYAPGSGEPAHRYTDTMMRARILARSLDARALRDSERPCANCSLLERCVPQAVTPATRHA
jgi:hypothetical protein